MSKNPAINGSQEIDSFSCIFEMQKQFQERVVGGVPDESIEWFSYHIQAMVEELGEVLKADKRWKTFRNSAYDKQNKLEEMADVFITAINLALFSGFDSKLILEKIKSKIQENNCRLDREDDNGSNS